MPGTNPSTFLVPVILGLISAAPAAALRDGELAGPIWGEGPESTGTGGTKDAGASVETSQQVASPLAPASGSTLTRISGRTTGTALLGADLVDLYEINITSAANFSANTIGSAFDTALFLFRRSFDSLGNPQAFPVVMNDNVASGSTWSRIGGASGAITGLTAGVHYIAISKSGALPIGFKTNDNDAQPLFTYSPGSTSVVFASAFQGTLALNDWANLGDGADYQINLTGAVVSRSSVCESAIVLGAGTYAFGDVGASDNAAWRIGLGSTCGDSVAWIANPSWFRLDPCSGTVQISACPALTTATYQMVLYAGSCGDLQPIDCGTLGACGGGTGATLTFTADPCVDYVVAFGPRRESGASPTSAGALTITCTPDGTSCGVAGSGSCFTARATPTCDSLTCCSAVCAADPYCCNVQWDNFCVQGAYAICAPPPACPPSDPDLDGNGVIDGGDLAILLSQWGT
jgi:hypothetical protein